MANKVYDFLGDTTGVTAVEYAVLGAGIFLAIVEAVALLGGATEAMYDSIAAAVKR